MRSGLDEHREAGRFLVAFDELLQEAGVLGALVAHHFGHRAERARGEPIVFTRTIEAERRGYN
jgi:hypothetical protein